MQWCGVTSAVDCSVYQNLHTAIILAKFCARIAVLKKMVAAVRIIDSNFQGA